MMPSTLVINSIAIVLATTKLVSCAPANYEKCGLSSNVGFRNWFDTPYLFTNSPVLFPQTDGELSGIVTIAQANGCKVRVRGSGQSNDGIVMQKLDELEDFDTVVVNLKDYTPDDASWNGVLDTSKPSVKMSAGNSLLQMMAIVRPQGYLPATHPDGAFFNLGGIYLNPSVHGATIDESRLAAQVLSFRVMNADGVITEYSDPESVKDLRGSMGLLGIVTALEIKLVPDDGYAMSLGSQDVGGYSDQDLKDYFASKYTTHDSIQFQYFVYTDSLVSFQIDFQSGAAEPIDAASTQDWYDAEVAAYPDLAYGGGNENALVWLVELLADWIDGSKLLASTVSTLTMQQSVDGFQSRAIIPRDGYYVPTDSVPRINLIHLFIPCETDCVDETLDLFVQSRDFAKNIIGGFSDWYPTLPLDWRIISVQPDELLLENLSPGKWLSWEYFTLYVEGDTTDTKYLKQLEDMWRSSYPDAQVHLGKAYGYGPVPGVGGRDEEFPFQDDSVLDNVYTPETKQAFLEKMNHYDPSGTFRAGSVLRLLEDTRSKYTPKQYNGDWCGTHQDADCISECCDFKIFAYDTCERNDKPKNESCDRDCECASNKCRWKWFSGLRCK